MHYNTYMLQPEVASTQTHDCAHLRYTQPTSKPAVHCSGTGVCSAHRVRRQWFSLQYCHLKVCTVAPCELHLDQLLQHAAAGQRCDLHGQRQVSCDKAQRLLSSRQPGKLPHALMLCRYDNKHSTAGMRHEHLYRLTNIACTCNPRGRLCINSSADPGDGALQLRYC